MSNGTEAAVSKNQRGAPALLNAQSHDRPKGQAMDDQALMPPAGSPTTLVDEGRITRVARALCIADGRDPDGTVISRAVEEVRTEFGALAEAPAWTSYAGEARRITAAMVALGIIE